MLEFKHLFVISDLHMGGRAPHQIFQRGKLLSDFIQWLIESYSNEEICLVINGDMIDFLAEPDADYFDPANALEKLDAIRHDPSFSMVWDALIAFVSHCKTTLMINMGNHDLELALPDVRAKLLEMLCPVSTHCKKHCALGRVHLICDGTGVNVRVGKSRVVCLHGNEADPANVCDYEKLRRIIRGRQLGQRTETWIPNAGTRLVIDVINRLKIDFPFVDVLKPEFQATIPILVALDQSSKPRILQCLRTARQLAYDRYRMFRGWLGNAEQLLDQSSWSDEAIYDRLISGALEEYPPDDENTAELLNRTEARLSNGENPIFMTQMDFLSPGTDSFDYVAQAISTSLLKAALLSLAADDRWDPQWKQDPYFQYFKQHVGPAVDFVVTGHTHIPRAIKYRSGDNRERNYFNSGSWANVFVLTRKRAKSSGYLESLISTIERDGGTAFKKQMDSEQLYAPVVHIHDEGTHVSGFLREFKSITLGLVEPNKCV